MRSIKEFLKKLLLLLFIVFNTIVSSQETIEKQSFKSAQKEYKKNKFQPDARFYRSFSNAQYFYTITEDGDRYRLINKKEQDVFNESYDTIVKNEHFIKTEKGDLVSIYRMFDLKKIEIPNLIQAYFMRDGLEVLTSTGAQYYDNAISKIDAFPPIELFKCGTVYSESFSLTYNKATKKHSIEISEGHFGLEDFGTTLDLKGLPENVESISFVSGKIYNSKSINNDYKVYPNILKVVKEGKSGLYSYDVENAVYPKKKKRKKDTYEVDKVTGDTIPVIIEPELLSFSKKGSVVVKEVLPIMYDNIQQSPINGLVYLYKDDKKGLYPNHTEADFSFFNEKTRSFYSIAKNGTSGWIDLRTFKEYYF